MREFLNILNHYITLETADRYEYVSIDECVYLWYYPLKFKTKNQNISKAIMKYNEGESYINYSSCTETTISDLKHEVRIGNKASKTYKELNFRFDKNYNKSQLMSSLFFSLSFLNKPIYIGSAKREEGFQKRTKEHLSLRSEFSIALNKKLENTNISLGDFLILALNVENIRNDYFGDELDTEYNLAEFIERVLINALKPIYNSKH